MTAETGAVDGACPIEIAFDGEGIPEGSFTSGNTVTFSPAGHHADLLSVGRAIGILRECEDSTVQGSGMHSPREIVWNAYQLQSEYGDDVRVGIHPQVTTEDHEHYPRTVVFGFSAVTEGAFTFPDVVRKQVGGTFEDADILQLTHRRISVVTDDHPLPGGTGRDLLDSVEDSL